MGSLMAGWDKKPWNEEKLMNRSKTSLTKEEIEVYRRKRQSAMEEHLKEAAAQNSAQQSETGAEQGAEKSAEQGAEQGAGTPNIDIPRVVEEIIEIPVAMSPDWWTRSNSAFLNSPPEKHILDKHSKYTAQFEVATKANQA